MRQRATSAALLVPLLLVVIALEGIVLSLAIAAITVLAAREVFTLLRSAGYPALLALGSALALTVVLDAAFPDVLEGSGLLLIAIGVVLIAVAAFTRPDPRDGLGTWLATVFGALGAHDVLDGAIPFMALVRQRLEPGWRDEWNRDGPRLRVRLRVVDRHVVEQHVIAGQSRNMRDAAAHLASSHNPDRFDFSRHVSIPPPSLAQVWPGSSLALLLRRKIEDRDGFRPPRS